MKKTRGDQTMKNSNLWAAIGEYNKKKYHYLRLYKETHSKIEAISRAFGVTKIEVVERAIDSMFEKNMDNVALKKIYEGMKK